MSGQINVTVTPYLDNGQVKWDLAVAGGAHGGYGHYPTISPSHGSTAFVYTIHNGSTPALQGWTFPAKGADALWVTNSGKDPTGPSSLPTVVNPATVQVTNNGLELHFVNLNPAKQQINYTLNFVKAGGQTTSTLDPIFDNTGPGKSRDVVWYAVGAIAVAVILYLVVRPMLTTKRERP